MNAPATAQPGAFAPFAHRAFAVLWTATLMANIGTWMRDVGLGWTMTELSPSATLVAAVQASAALPVVLLALPAGALADVLDRRRLLFAAQAGLGLLSLALALLAWAGLLTPAVLLLAAALGGIGAALSAPAWQAIVPQLVPRPVLRPAVAMNSLGINIARAIGPALGGVVLATAGVAAVFALDALSFLGILAALAWWRVPATERRAPPERVVGALAAGLRYARGSPGLKRVLLRAAAFFLFASAPWALLPLVARGMAGGGPGLYGLLLTAIGAGAVAGALLLPSLRARLGLGAGGTVLAGTAGVALAGTVLALAPGAAFAVAACALLGLAWIAVLTSINVAAQSALPDWVRARGLALYLSVFSGGMMTGGLLWGAVAELAGVSVSLLAAALLGLGAGVLVRGLALPESGEALVPSDHMPGHQGMAAPPAPDAGPVLVQVEYRLRQPEDRDALLAALAPLEAVRRRDGAEGWYALSDPDDPLKLVEAFLVRDWAEHERMHARATRADTPLHEAANAFDAEGRPHVRHLVGATAAAVTLPASPAHPAA
jgi:MFS family permease